MRVVTSENTHWNDVKIYYKYDKFTLLKERWKVDKWAVSCVGRWARCCKCWNDCLHIATGCARGGRNTAFSAAGLRWEIKTGWERGRRLDENERWAGGREMEGKRGTDRERDESGEQGRWMDRLRECIALAWLTAMPHSQLSLSLSSFLFVFLFSSSWPAPTPYGFLSPGEIILLAWSFKNLSCSRLTSQ